MFSFVLTLETRLQFDPGQDPELGRRLVSSSASNHRFNFESREFSSLYPEKEANYELDGGMKFHSFALSYAQH